MVFNRALRRRAYLVYYILGAFKRHVTRGGEETREPSSIEGSFYFLFWFNFLFFFFFLPFPSFLSFTLLLCSTSQTISLHLSRPVSTYLHTLAARCPCPPPSYFFFVCV